MDRPMTAVGRQALSQTPPAYACKLPNGEVCVTQEPSHQLLCLTLSGELRNVVDPAGELLKFPTGVACDADSLYVADGLADCVYRLRLPDFKLAAASSASIGLHYPHGVCLHTPGSSSDEPPTLYVADWGNHRIVALDAASLQPRFSFGSKGKAPGDFMYPRGVSSLSAETLLVADTDNSRLQLVAARDGTPLRQIGGVQQPYAALGAPGAGGDGLAFVATMGGRLCILPVHEGSPHASPQASPSKSPAAAASPGGRSGGFGDGGFGDGGFGNGGFGNGGFGNGGAAAGALSRVGRTKEVPMPSAGRILCGLCADERRVLVCGLDSERQLHLLAARPGVTDGASSRGDGGGGVSERSGRPSAASSGIGLGSSGAAAGGGGGGYGYPGAGGGGGGGGGYGGSSGSLGAIDVADAGGGLRRGAGSGSLADGGGGSKSSIDTAAHAVDILRLDAGDATADANSHHELGPFIRRAGSARAGRRATPNSSAPPVQLE